MSDTLKIVAIKVFIACLCLIALVLINADLIDGVL